jgi:hypothetical protein
MAIQAQKMVERGVGPSKFESTSTEQRSELIQNYGGLYTQSRVETLDYLDKLEELRGADELKSKLLFSVIVVISPLFLSFFFKSRVTNCFLHLVGIPFLASYIDPNEGSHQENLADSTGLDASVHE